MSVLSSMICSKFRTIATSEISFDVGALAEKSLFIHTFASPASLNPICSLPGLKGPTALFNLLYPVKALKWTCRISGKGMCCRA